MALAHAFAQRTPIVISPQSTRPDRHSLVIVNPTPRSAEDLESILGTAERRGFTKIATVLRNQIAERDYALLDRVASAVGQDPVLGQSLIQFAVSGGVLRCRARVDEKQEARLIELLGELADATRVAVEVIR
ncbi:MAG: hypothetical protein ACSLFQ_09550 [Thermoanaerobaculia bacterium]